MPPKIPLPKVYAGPVTPGPKATVNAGFVSQLADNLGTFVGIFNPWKRAQEKRDHMAEMEALVPGATERVARGEVIPSYLIETKGKLGWETQQLMAGNKDPWQLEKVSAPRAGPNRPNIIYTNYEHRFVACIDCMDHMHYVNYVLIRINEIGRCRDCGNCFHLKKHPEPELFFDDPSRHFDH